MGAYLIIGLTQDAAWLKLVSSTTGRPLVLFTVYPIVFEIVCPAILSTQRTIQHGLIVAEGIQKNMDDFSWDQYTNTSWNKFINWFSCGLDYFSACDLWPVFHRPVWARFFSFFVRVHLLLLKPGSRNLRHLTGEKLPYCDGGDKILIWKPETHNPRLLIGVQ